MFCALLPWWSTCGTQQALHGADHPRLLVWQIKTTLLVSLAWMIFNMIPPYLLMHYQFIGRGTTLKIACKCVTAAPHMSSGSSSCASSHLAKLPCSLIELIDLALFLHAYNIIPTLR